MQPQHKCILLQLGEFPECSDIAGNFVQISFKLLKAIVIAAAATLACEQFGQPVVTGSVLAMPGQMNTENLHHDGNIAFIHRQTPNRKTMMAR